MLPVNLQPRGIEKNIRSDSTIKKTDSVITINDIYHWQQRYESQTKSISWNPESKQTKRRAGTPEDSLYTLKGYMWYVHQIGFDCDYHIEIGGEDSTDNRIVVEVPQSNKTLQKIIRDHLDSLHLPIFGCTEKNHEKAHFKKGIPVLVTGFGFYDNFHKVNKTHGDAHTNKYLWEIHPVTEIVFL